MEPEEDLVSELARRAEVDSLCARVLANRGVLPADASGFLSPSLKTLRAPEEEAWRVAARRVARAVKSGSVEVAGSSSATAPAAQSVSSKVCSPFATWTALPGAG